VGIDEGILLSQCGRVLERTDLVGVGRREEGKVRDSYIAAGRRVIVVTDRVSCFDAVVGTLPFKGQVLNQVAAFWFEKTSKVAPNHLIAVPDPNASIVRECKTLPIEFVMRAHLTGITSTSIWTAYARGERVYCGHRLPEGLRQHEALSEPLLTPTTKAAKGQHDEPVSRAEILAQGILDEQTFDRAARVAHALFAEGRRWAESRGLVLADTKYELGLDENGEIIVIDEIHTPDSSRYWLRESFERALREGGNPTALDKEYVRRWLLDQGYRGEGPAPPLPDEVRCEAARRYIEAYERVTGLAFAPDLEPAAERLARNLRPFAV
jgi:phosphoribosylaminoimidazole-succinocarboxamide synthase